MIIIDSSFYVSAAINTDSNYTKARSIFGKIKKNKNSPICTTEDLLKETLTVISQKQGKDASVSFYKNELGNTQVFPITTERFLNGMEIFLNPIINKNISLIDCITAVIYKEIDAKGILTFDKHFKDLGLKIVS